MGIEFEKCEKCHECKDTDCFPICFCCEYMINGSYCESCVSSKNCVDTKHQIYMCNDCLQNASDSKIEYGGSNYYIKNIKTILKTVKQLRKKIK